ncbi:hypothetical protein [Spirosoma endophyticum]|uniref:Uncharacterized protein n=1 Tax=Spirosoma endophyticum TaxID=662367 RepID=A0A1I1L6U1_9BACT|nr:hypothetical protein [Spirosoma endophyticum]SFC68746.1 hypothetical protein SAMN05216167_102153 [Spirosoma endophyticum]
MKHILLVIFLILHATYACFSQSDTIYTNTEKIICIVHEITIDSVKFTQLNEALITSIHKNTVQKIISRSGQIQMFSEPPTYNKVIGPDDWENVSMTRAASEVRNFRQVGTVNAEMEGSVSVNPAGALAGAILGSMGIAKKRLFRKLKMQCAMSGGNLIHTTQIDSTGGIYIVLANRTAAMNVSGISYTTMSLNAQEFRAKLKEKTTFTCIEKMEMSSNAFQFTKSQFDSIFKLNFVVFESDLLYANGTLNNVPITQFRVTGFTNEHFILMCKVKSTIYNYRIKF